MKNFVDAGHNGNHAASDKTESFADLIDQYAPEASFADLVNLYTPAAHDSFEVITGTVTALDKNGFRVDIGGKSESFVPLHEAGDIEVGQTQKFVVLGPAMAFGRPGEFDETALCLSHRRIEATARIIEMKAKDEVGEAVVIGVNRSKYKRDAGLDVRIGDISGFIPREELLLLPGMSNLRDFVGKTVRVKAEVAQTTFGDRSKHVFSNKKAEIQHYLSTLRQGQVIEGEVVRYSFKEDGGIKGAVVKVAPGVTGYVPNSLVAFSRDRKTEEALPIGAKIKATVDEVSPKKLNLKLSTRKATIDWDAVKACTGVVGGKVVHIVERLDHQKGTKVQTQALIQLDNGLTAQVWHADVTPRSRVAIGERIPRGTYLTTLVKDYDRTSGRIKVDLTPMSDPILARLEASKGLVVQGKVMSEAEFGYFIGFDNGDGVFIVEGLCHKHKLKKADGSDEPEKLQLGEIVSVRVENVMRTERTVSLSRKDVDG